MPTVSVLYIDDKVVGPHLELLRNVCEPFSKSRPHVTVRYFEKLAIPENHLDVPVTHIDLMEAGSFGLDSDKSAQRTVYIRCESDELLLLEHKPHFPASEFHITIYDGKSDSFAKALLRTLKEFDWHFRVPLSPTSTLSRIDIKSRRSKGVDAAREYTSQQKALFRAATKKELSWAFVINLNDKNRIDLAKAICKHLHQKTSAYQKVKPRKKDQGFRTKHVLKDDQPLVHLTPPELARDIAEYAVGLLPGNDKIHFGDPAVGTGTFYSGLLQVVPREKIASAIGVDISREQVEAATWRWKKKGMKVMVGDYLHMERLPRRNLILANPPYLRHQAIPAKYKQDLRERASVTMRLRISARSGLYVYFMLLSHPWMKPNAIGAWLVPAEFMKTDYGIAVREYLATKVQLIRIHQFGPDSPQFENVKVMPSVVFFRNAQPSSEHVAHLSYGGTVTHPESNDFVTISDLRDQRKWHIPWQAKGSALSPSIRLADLFIIRRGIATGANEFFVLDRTEASKLGLPKSALRPLLPKARNLKNDIIERKTDGYPRLHPQLCLLDCSLSEDEIERRHPRLFQYLNKIRASGVLTRTLLKERHPWYRQERRQPAPFLCTYMGRGNANGGPIRFIWNKSDAVVTNTYLMLYPRPPLNKLLKERPELTAKLFEILRDTSQTTLSENWRMHAGGLCKIEPGDLSNVHLSAYPPWLTEIATAENLEQATSTIQTTKGSAAA